MFTFHEGLPGHGKTWEAVVYHILPAISKQRKVFTNIRGMDHGKVSELTGVHVDRVSELLVQIEWDDTRRIDKLVENDALVVIDELQDFWPAKGQVSPEITEFVTQHRHRGLDLVAMGQDLRDCHALWKRRVENKVVFVKQSALGRDHKYAWTMFKAKGPEKFQKINNGTREYEPRFFGVYKTKRDDATNMEHYKDDRANLLKTKFFRFQLPLVFIMAGVAVWYLWGFFHKSPVHVAPKNQERAYVVNSPKAPAVSAQPANLAVVPATAVASAASSVAVAKTDANEAYKPEQYPVDLFQKYRPRLAAMIEGTFNGRHRVEGRIEVMDDSFHVKEEFTFKQLAEMGWSVQPMERGVFVSRNSDGLRYLVTAWPIDPFGRAADATTKQLGPEKDTAAS
ncbi:zonular occludens toxin domain-containing protein [Silvimonas soli]|uniref:zonular occludens toxin domain-containing protein n=1 Tax=Silvimonas soli TaxID=2980100 RepID=UPI0024B34ADB|nr:zonular occludens toxin domain-containing protein [Silvimonas soli]